MEAATKVRFELTREDFVTFMLYHNEHSPLLRTRRLRAIGLFGGIGLFVMVAKIFRPDFPDFLWIIGPSILISVGIGAYSHKGKVRRNCELLIAEGLNKGLFGLKEIALSPAQISTTGTHSSGSFSWPVVEKVVTTSEALYVFIGAASALIVPRRAFETPEAFETFVATARQYQAEVVGRSK